LLLALGEAVFLAGVAIPRIVGADECQRLAAGIAGVLFALLVSTVSRGFSSFISPNVIIFLVYNCDIARLDTDREAGVIERLLLLMALSGGCHVPVAAF
jgi:hypothetical protein